MLPLACPVNLFASRQLPSKRQLTRPSCSSSLVSALFAPWLRAGLCCSPALTGSVVHALAHFLMPRTYLRHRPDVTGKKEDYQSCL